MPAYLQIQISEKSHPVIFSQARHGLSLNISDCGFWGMDSFYAKEFPLEAYRCMPCVKFLFQSRYNPLFQAERNTNIQQFCNRKTEL